MKLKEFLERVKGDDVTIHNEESVKPDALESDVAYTAVGVVGPSGPEVYRFLLHQKR
jgi:hypothetical protein